MAETSTSTGTSKSVAQNLVDLLTQSIQTLAAEVTRTYDVYTRKKIEYQNILAYEAELDRQRTEKIGQHDWYNADILASKLRDEVRPTRERIGIETEAARVDWVNAQTALDNAKANLSAAEQQLLEAQIAEGQAQAQAGVAIANAQLTQAQSTAQLTQARTAAELAAAQAAAEEEAAKAKRKKMFVVGGIVVGVIVLGVVIYFKFFKK